MKIVKGLTKEEYERLKAEKPHLLKRWGLLDIEIEAKRPGCCPECGAPLTYQGGCCVCQSCGYSECG